MRSVSFGVSAALSLALVLSAEAAAQTPAGRGGQPGNAGQQPEAAQAHGAIAMTALSFSVSDLARSVTFYRTAFGLETFGATMHLPSMNAAMVGLVNAGGAKYRQATFRVPHTGVVLRLMEFSGVERASHKPGVSDPGQVRPRFLVSDMDVALASLKLAGAEIVSSSGGQADTTTNPTQVVARDPDGYVFEVERDENIRSMAMTDVTPVVGLHVELTTADTAKKLAFYKDVLSFEVAPGAWSTLSGAGELKRSTSDELGGPKRLLDVAEYRDGARAKLAGGRIQDPATGVVSFIVRDLDAALNAVKQAKLRVVTTGGAPVTLVYLQARRIVVQDPDGAFVEMIEH